uniref:Uncharacterized protein n=1 Tax=viral metagenome TaxID=1070528 RepID=A0A6C0ENT8_9ZZZZ
MENVIFNINSAFREKHYKSNDFVINMRSTIKNIIYIKVTSVEIPNVSYTFRDSLRNNFFDILYQYDNKTYKSKIYIGEGNHTSNSIVSNIQEQFDNIALEFDFNLKITLDTVSGRIFILSDKIIFIDFSTSELNFYLGFSNKQYKGYKINAEGLLNIIRTPYIFIKINDIENIIDNKVSNVFTKVVLNSEKYTYHFQSFGDFNSKDKFFRGPIDIDKFHISLVDCLGDPLYLNGMDFSMTIECGTIYDRKLYKKMLSKGIPNGDKRLNIHY